MLTRSKARADKKSGGKSETSASSSKSSAAATIKAQILEAEAQHLRKIAELEQRALESERAVAEAEHRAHVASLEALSIGSRRSSRSRNSLVDDWLNHGVQANVDPVDSSLPPRTLMGTSVSATVVAMSVPCSAPTDSMVVPPSDVTLCTPRKEVFEIPQTYQGSRTVAVPYPLTTSLPISTPPLHTSISLTYPYDTYNFSRFSAPIYTTAPQGVLPASAPITHPGVARMVARDGCETGCSWMPTRPAAENTLPHSLGTHVEPKYMCSHTNKKASSQTDTLQLAQAVAEIATATAAHRVAKVSTNLPTFDGKPTDWLIFKRVYDSTSPSYSPAENLSRLSTSLRGPARDAVAVLLAAACDPQEVVRALEVEFARPERIILSELTLVRALPKISNLETASEISTFACRVRHCIEVIRLLDVPEYLASPELSNEIIGKFTISLRSRWAEFAFSRESVHPKRFRLEILSEFLLREADLKSKYDFIFDSKRDTPTSKVGYKSVKCHVTTSDTKPSTSAVTTARVCLFCGKAGHNTPDCKSFQTISLDDRWEWVTDKKVCHKCFLKGNHFYRKCKKFACEKPNCGSRNTHHTLLHRDMVEATVSHVSSNTEEPLSKNVLPITTKETSSDASANVVLSHSCIPESPRHPLLKVVPVNVSGPKGTVSTFALLDDGSTATLVDSSVAHAVGATGKRSVLRVNAVGGMSKQSEVTFVTLEVTGRNNQRAFTLENVRSIPNLSLSCQTVKSDDLLPYDYLSDIVDEVSYGDAKPMLLIGIDNWHLIVPHSIRRGSRHQPVATLTSLGWVLFGHMKSKSSPVEFINHCEINESDSLDQQLKEYFRIDSLGICKKEYLSDDNKRAVSILEQTTRRLPNGRFETGLPWRANIEHVPNSRELAYSRFVSLERKMKKDKAYADAYRDNINATIKKGYAELCTEPPRDNGITWYLPHFGVYHPQKHKLRVVHDAAATSSGVSLNSLLLPGPDLLQPLLAILMRFREGSVALNGDIREMFPQTKIRPEDRDAQRFFWRDDPSQPCQEFRMSSMIFGATSSPFTAIYLKNRNAEDHRYFSPTAADAIIKDHYMDDYLGSVDSVEEAAKLASDIVYIHSKACLEMRSWVSNRPEALSSLPPDLRAPDTASVNVRILGVSWNVREDVLSFSRSSLANLPSKLTKRSALAYLMQIYDPLGLLTPIIIKGRALFQETWKLGIDWDQDLPPPLSNKWNDWFVDLKRVTSGSIPRHYSCGRQVRLAELHVFGDASELAYACVAYWRFTLDDNSVMLSLIGGKACLAPMKTVSIPRLELQAALMVARFASYIVDAHKRKPDKVFLWTDSLTVLKWLRADISSLKTFVAHRVGEISELSDVTDWHYVPTSFNIADDATRFNSRFDMTSRWFSGPQFLLEPHCQWPTEPSGQSSSLGLNEIKRHRIPPSELVGFTTTDKPAFPPVPEPTRFSKWLRLLRSTARVIQCAKIFRTPLDRKHQNSKFPCRTGSVSASASRSKLPLLDVDHLEQAERNLLLYSQLQCFENEYSALLMGNQLPKNSKLHKFEVFIDENGLLRLKGRISAVQGVGIEKNPVIVHGKDPIVRLLIQSFHEKTAHAGSNMIINELRQRFYIVGIRCSVKSVVRACLECQLKKNTPSCPPVGNLPAERLEHHVRPFTHVGLDYFGPVSISVGRRTEKRWIALFTCLSIRAVHLEVVGSLSSDSAIMAIRRFIARRGAPHTIFSDNGTAFVGANRELRELFKEPVQEFATNHRIRWKFIPPASPFMGGCWERLIRSVKTALSYTLKERSPSEEVLDTLLAEVEYILNSRPLTHVDTEPDCDEAITPFHFILGSSATYAPLAQVDDADLVRRIQWRKGLRLADHFWARWLKEYLPSLVSKQSKSPSSNIKINDVVLIADGNLPRGVWPRGRVIRVLPGSDGVVRIADVDTSHGVLRRPVRKLVRLTT